MTFRQVTLLLAAVVACCTPLSCAPRNAVTLQGSGATFPAPLYKRWFLEHYHRHPDVRVNYLAIGSGAGIRQFTEGLVHFGASDAAMTDEEMARVRKERGVGVLLLPMTAGSIVLSYNVPGAPPDLKFTREAYLGICLGKITSWNDKAIAQANQGVDLPDLPITLVRRAEGSGTTFAFTSHLQAVGKALRNPWTPGAGKSVVWRHPGETWPNEIGARGNSGVAAVIQQTPGAIGYLEYGYADLVQLPMGVLENKEGKFVKPGPDSGKAALAGAQMPEYPRDPKDFIIRIPDPGGDDAYPIATFTWLLCYQKYKDPQVAAALKEVLRYGLTEGQQISPELGYLTLPEKIAQKVLGAVDGIEP
jgi:phosphate transport system substrate-binding protein